MNTKIKLLAVATMSAAVFSCQKPGDNGLFEGDKLTDLQIASTITVNCPPITLTSPITAPTTLTAGNSYLLDDVVVVSGTTLTIQPGVVIFADPGAALVVQPNATINAAGTATDPIIFTSHQAPGSRAPGDWIGVFLLGNAPNNHSNNLSVVIDNTTYSAGGSSPASSVGTFAYVQIHYAGEGGGLNSDRRSESGLVMASLGSTSDIHHIQVTESDLDGVGIWGGEFFPKHIFVHKARRTDFMVSYGFQGNGQYFAGFKHNTTPNTTNADAYAMDISNDLAGVTTATPLTYPTFSNTSYLGWDFCSSFNNADAIIYKNNGNGRIYNSVISSYSRYGLVLAGTDVVDNTSGALGLELQFAYNSFHNITGIPQYNTNVGTWTGCGTSMADWINGPVLFGCEEDDNQFSVTTLGLNSGNICITCPDFPDFSLGVNSLQLPNYSWDSGSDFEHPDDRGAFGATSWITSGWADFCPLNFNYCI